MDESKNEVREPNAQTQHSPITTTTTELKDMLAEAGKVLKALSTAHMKSMKTTGLNDEVGSQVDREGSYGLGRLHGGSNGLENEDKSLGGLLDSGASNSLRPARDGEMEMATRVKVTLAGEDTKVLNQTALGTIIVPDDKGQGIQPIVPLGALITELGCTLHWTRNYLKLIHPRHGNLRVQLRNNCPEVAVSDALTLIKELEEAELVKLNEKVSSMSAKLEMIQKQEETAWDDLMRQYVDTGRRDLLHKAVLRCPYTKNLPTDVQDLLIEGFNKDDGKLYLKQLPLSRRERRRLLASNAWVVHLYAGEPSAKVDPLKAVNLAGKVLLEVDVCNSRLWDLHRPHGVYQLLLWAASCGKIDDIIGGPPCRTYSALLHRPREGYPQPARSSAFPYGLPTLDPRRRAMVDKDTALVAKQLVVWNLAQLARGDDVVGFFLEHPRDPGAFIGRLGEVGTWLEEKIGSGDRGSSGHPYYEGRILLPVQDDGYGKGVAAQAP